MAEKFIAACIQNNATPDVRENIEVCLRLSKDAANAGAQFIATPEYFSGLRTERRDSNPDTGQNGLQQRGTPAAAGQQSLELD